MFKKAPHELKTSGTIRASDRRKLKAQVSETFALHLDSETLDLLIPEGLQSRKFRSHLDEPGIIYLSPDGEPLFFTLGKQSTVLIPTVYTLWKRPLVPLLSTSAAVIERLVGGADLMIPGVAESPDDLPLLKAGDIVGVAMYGSSVPLAVGTMAVPSSSLTETAKGKAVLTLHAYRDYLWELGSKRDPPDTLPEIIQDMNALQLSDTPVAAECDQVGSQAAFQQDGFNYTSGPLDVADTSQPVEQTASVQQAEGPSRQSLSPNDVDDILHRALIQSISTNISSLLPILGTTMYTAHILPSRPSNTSLDADIRHSTFKKLTKFLKTVEKEGLIRLKEIRGEVWVTSVNASHEKVIQHRSFKTLKDLEKKEARRMEQEDKQRLQQASMTIQELFKPLGSSTALFEIVSRNTSDLYSVVELRTLLLDYINSHSLVHSREQEYILLDDVLRPALLKKDEHIEFMRREDAIDRLKGKMQAWHSISPSEGQDPIVRKGQLKPISVVVKTRQGKRALTLITDFEPFGLLPDALSEELRKLCASATSVSALPGKPSLSEVLVQGKQLKPVQELLMAKGIPKKWIHTEDLTGKK